MTGFTMDDIQEREVPLMTRRGRGSQLRDLILLEQALMKGPATWEELAGVLKCGRRTVFRLLRHAEHSATLRGYELRKETGQTAADPRIATYRLVRRRAP